MSTPAPEFVINRLLDAPRELIFKAWTEADRLSKWWGPAGFEIRVHTLDLKPGGLFHFSMRAAVGETWGRFVYEEIVPSERLVFISSFSDPKGHITRALFSPLWPLEVRNTLTLTTEGHKTRAELRGTPVHATEAESQHFVSAFPFMQHGFGGSLDQLSVYLMLNKS